MHLEFLIIRACTGTVPDRGNKSAPSVPLNATIQMDLGKPAAFAEAA